MLLSRFIFLLIFLSPGLPVSAQAQETAQVGIAIFNMAWAGTIDDFKRHVEVCSAPEVNWCDSRIKIPRGTQHAAPEEEIRAKRCREATIEAAGGFEAMMMTAPCNAYGKRKHPARAETVENYDAKLSGLRATIENLIQNENIKVIAFQEVKSREVIEQVLGEFSGQFNVCVAPHDAFQTVAFAWDKSISSISFAGNSCVPNLDLAITEQFGDEPARHRVRPGLALRLVINGVPVTFLNIHLKSGCANLKTDSGFMGHKLTDPDPACEVLNRQVPILEDWVANVARESPRFVLFGDFNRRIDEEERALVAKSDVRTDGTDPAEPNTKDEWGRVKSSYLWQEIADGFPAMHQVPLISSERGCNGLKGLDHIVISDAIKQSQTRELSSRKITVVKKRPQPIVTSDHCPSVTVLEL
ncbi:Endonuclease/Exonuclease/phosphatase family protein [Nitrosospira sp. Nsp13]|nr:Endonuclease/Exonuclease/phosphatase family protein [Nitrosospira sp. Nsp13]